MASFPTVLHVRAVGRQPGDENGSDVTAAGEGLRYLRHPRSAKAKDRGGARVSADMAVRARPSLFQTKKKYSLRDVVVNDGLHYHAILLLPPWSRTDDIDMHFEDLRPIYRQRASLDRVDVEPIISRFRYVQGYGYKSILKMHFDVGDHFVLPRALKELAA